MAISKKTSQHLAECRKLMRTSDFLNEKQAALGGDGNDTQFEQAFSNLAHAFIKDKAPSLLDHEVGFQLMDRNEDNTKAIGIFGFKVGTQWLYAPVFSLNGDMKGTELLYIKDQDQFVPLKENWLNYILQRKPNVMGEEVNRNLSQLGVLSPDLQAFSRPPAKFASANGMETGEAAFAYFATSNPLTDDKYSNLKTLPDFLKEAGLSVVKSLIKGIESFPAIADAIEQTYGLKTIKQAIAEASKVEEKEAAKKVKWIKQQVLDKDEEEEDDSPVKPKGVLEAYNGNIDRKVIREKASAVAILTAKTVTERGIGFEPTDKEKENIITEGYSVRDERPETAVAFEVQTPLSLTSPTCTGVYDILCRPSEFCKSLVIYNPVGPKGTANFSTIVDLDEKKKQWTNIHPGNVWTRERATQAHEMKELQESLPDATPAKLKEDGLYVLVGGNKEGTLPFRVKEKIDGDDASANFKVEFMDYSSAGRPANLPQINDRNKDSYNGYNRDFAPYGCGCSSILHLTNKTGGRMRNHYGELYVPQGFKVIELSDSGDDGHSDRSEKPPIQYGNLLDLQKAIYEKTAGLTVRHSGTHVDVNGVNLSPKEATTHLIQSWCLREKQARAIVKIASEKKVVSYRVKFPEGYEKLFLKSAAPGDPIDRTMTAVSGAPPFPSPPSGLEQTMLGSVQSLYPQQEALPVMPTGYNLVGNEQIYDPRLPDPKTMAIGYKAQQAGQKEVFDTSMIGSLLKNVRSDSMVDKYLGDLMKGMDRIGRILFSFYWHGEEMQDRYGKKDMPELEESLRNAFEAVGDVVLFLKQKTVEPFPEEGFSPDLGNTAD